MPFLSPCRHVTPERARKRSTTRTPPPPRPPPRTRPAHHARNDWTSAHTATDAASAPDNGHDTPTFHANNGHNVRGPHCRPHGQKKAPTRAFPVGGGAIYYSVTIFTISSAVFPSRARTNFAFASPLFTSGMCFSASWSNLASPGVNLFNRSKIAKQ